MTESQRVTTAAPTDRLPRPALPSPSNREFVLIAVLLVVVTAIMVALVAFGMDTLSSVRAYVGGEGRWSKAQKNAVHALGRFAATRDEGLYRTYLREIAVPLGDRLARLELEREKPDPGVIRRGFIAGGNQAADVPGMTRLFRRFRHVDQLQRSIAIWAQGDIEIARLQQVGEAMYAAAVRDDTASLRYQLEELDGVNERVSVLEDAFSRTLGEAARWVAALLFKVIVSVAALLVIGGIAVSRRMLGQIRASEAALKDIESAMLRAQKLESLGVLAGGIAHDFNNLLTVIIGHANVLRLDPALPSDLREGAGEIEIAATRAAELTTQMLAFAGRGRLVPGTINVNALVQDMAQLLASSVSKKARIEYALAAEAPTVVGDATQLRQIVMNLITNASEALGEREGTIRLTTGTMDATREYLAGSYLEEKMQPGRFAFVEVTDNGEGMDEATVRKIFEPFFTTKFSGRGLGLSAVLGIVRSHGGAIRVTSTPGIGTSIRVLVPPSDGLSPAATPPPALRDSGNKRNLVLVVDDEEAIRRMARGFLEPRGYQVVTTNDGIEAIEMFRQRGDEVAAVVLDITMPRMDGVAACRALRQLRAELPVVLSSGYSIDDLTAQLAGDPNTVVLAKPYTAEDLVRAVRTAMSV